MAIKKQTFIKGVMVIMIAQILVKFFGFIYRVILTNIDGFNDVGNSYYGSGYQIYIFILAIATMGIPNTISKLVSEKRAIGDIRGAHRIFKTSLFVFTFIGFIFGLLLFLSSEYISLNILSNPGVKYTLMVLSPAIIFVSIASVFRGYFVGMQNMIAHSMAQILEQITNSILSIVFVFMLINKKPEIMAAGSTAATAVATFIALIYLVIYYNKNKKDILKEVNESEKFQIDRRKEVIKKIISYLIPISFGSIVVALAGVIDLVTVMKGLEKFGYTAIQANAKFGIILGKVDILTSIPLALNVAFATSLIPVVSAAIIKNDKKEAVEKINYSMKMSSIIAFPAAVGLIVLARPIISMLFPNALEGAYLLRIGAIVVIFSVIAQTSYGALHGLGKLYIPGLALLIGAVTKYIINIMFIPKYGEIIVPISTIIYQFLACIIALFILYKTLKTKIQVKNTFLKPIISTVFMAFAIILTYKSGLYITKSNTLSTLISILAGMLVYISVLTAFKTMTIEEVQTLPYGNQICKALRKCKKM